MKVLIMDAETRIRYKNWKGNTSDRTIVPHFVWYGCTQYHPEHQMLVRATDTAKYEIRDFALKDMEIL